MSWREDDLQFMRWDVGMSVSQISDETGIPVSSVSYVTRGLRSLTTSYDVGLRNAYKRSTYTYLRNNSFDTSNSNRFRGYSVSTLREVSSQMNQMIQGLANGAYLQIYRYTQDRDQVNWNEVYNDMVTRISDGMSNSQVPHEEKWQDYPWR